MEWILPFTDIPKLLTVKTKNRKQILIYINKEIDFDLIRLEPGLYVKPGLTVSSELQIDTKKTP